MAVTDLSYIGLQNAIIDWMVRPDLTTAQIKDAIWLFECEATRRLRVRDNETSVDLTTVAGVASVPDDFASWRTMTWNGSPNIQLEYNHPNIVRAAYGTPVQDTPRWFTTEGDTFLFRPVDDGPSAFTLRYFQKISNLTDTMPTNWLLTKHADLYLAGSLYNAYKFVRDPDAASAYNQIMQDAFNQIIDLNERFKEPAELRPMTVIV